MVLQYSALHFLLGWRDIDPTMGPAVSGAHSWTRARAFANVYVQWPYKIPGGPIPPVTGHLPALFHPALRRGHFQVFSLRQHEDRIHLPRHLHFARSYIRNSYGFTPLFLRLPI